MNKAKPKIRILIADDHRLVLDGIVSLIRKEKQIEIADTATNGLDALHLMQKNKYDVCMVDINMPSIDGLEIVKRLGGDKSKHKILILTTYNEEEIITEMLQLGVAGYILKNSTRQELVQAIHKVAGGGLYFSDEVYHTVIKNLKERDTSNKKIRQPARVTLTKREIEIVGLLAKEYTNEKIAERLSISYRTVETHRKNIMQKTEAHNLAGLLRFAYSEGIIK